MLGQTASLPVSSFGASSLIEEPTVQAPARGFVVPQQKRWSLSIRGREALDCYIFILPAVLGVALFSLGPMLASLYLSFTEYDMLGSPKWIGAANYQELWNDELFWKSLKVTTIYSAVSVPLVLLTGLGLAVLLNQKFPGVTFFRSVYYLPTVMSGVAVSMLWRWIYNRDFGLINLALDKVGIIGPGWLTEEEWALPALILTSVWTAGGSMLIFLAGLQEIPADLYEAAEIDGAGRWNRFRNITVPLISHVTFFNLVLGIIGALQVFTEAFVLTKGGPNNATLLLSFFLYRNAFQFLKMGYASAIGWVMFLIVLALTLVVFRTRRRWVHHESDAAT
jgi:multiple sugar transport system permease protein